VSSRAAAPLGAMSAVTDSLRRESLFRCPLPTFLPMESDASSASEETHDRVLPHPVSPVVPKDVVRSRSQPPDECRAARVSRLGRIPKDTP
jgi:hypothetical protein